LLFFLTRSPPSVLSPLSLHDALPIFVQAMALEGLVELTPASPAGRRAAARLLSQASRSPRAAVRARARRLVTAIGRESRDARRVDRKSTRLNSSHVKISYAVFCLKKK